LNHNDQQHSNQNPQRFKDATITHEILKEQKEVTIRVSSSATDKEKKYIPLYDGTLNKESYLLMINNSLSSLRAISS